MQQPQALIIEDEIDLANIFEEALARAGYATDTAHNGPDAVQRLKESVPNLVVLDLHLPGLDGSKVLKEIRADPRLARTRVLIATADAAMARFIEKDADFVMLKPISFSQMRDIARRLYVSFTAQS
jgi:CheY-like chemotaxis protein